MSPNKDLRGHPLADRPGFSRYLRSEQIALEADALLAAWKPLTSPEHLDKAERFMNQYAASGDLLSFPWEKDPALLEDLELATYYHEALKIYEIAMLWFVPVSAKLLETEWPSIKGGRSRVEKQQRLMEAFRQKMPRDGQAGTMIFHGTKAWLELVEPAIAPRRASMKQAISEEERFYSRRDSE